VPAQRLHLTSRGPVRQIAGVGGVRASDSAEAVRRANVVDRSTTRRIDGQLGQARLTLYKLKSTVVMDSYHTLPIFGAHETSSIRASLPQPARSRAAADLSKDGLTRGYITCTHIVRCDVENAIEKRSGSLLL
jgi:hypothetical protein